MLRKRETDQAKRNFLCTLDSLYIVWMEPSWEWNFWPGVGHTKWVPKSSALDEIELPLNKLLYQASATDPLTSPSTELEREKTSTKMMMNFPDMTGPVQATIIFIISIEDWNCRFFMRSKFNFYYEIMQGTHEYRIKYKIGWKYLNIFVSNGKIKSHDTIEKSNEIENERFTNFFFHFEPTLLCLFLFSTFHSNFTISTGRFIEQTLIRKNFWYFSVEFSQKINPFYKKKNLFFASKTDFRQESKMVPNKLRVGESWNRFDNIRKKPNSEDEMKIFCSPAE